MEVKIYQKHYGRVQILGHALCYSFADFFQKGEKV